MRRTLAALVLAMALPSTTLLALPARAQLVVVVKDGDTLSDIAARHRVSLNRLMQANGISDPDLVVVGQRLTIPGGAARPAASGGGGGSVTVQPGDTLSDIAARQSVSLSRLMQANGISDPDLVVVGQRLTIPGGAGRSAAAAPPRSQPTAPYTVKPGETLSEIAARFNTSTARLIQLNGIQDPDLLTSGTRLSIPMTPRSAAAPQAAAARPAPNRNAREHVVQGGESLSLIAERYGTSVSQLVALNRIEDPDRLLAGTRLQLRGTPPAAASKPADQPRPAAEAKPQPAAQAEAKPEQNTASPPTQASSAAADATTAAASAAAPAAPVATAASAPAATAATAASVTESAASRATEAATEAAEAAAESAARTATTATSAATNAARSSAATTGAVAAAAAAPAATAAATTRTAASRATAATESAARTAATATTAAANAAQTTAARTTAATTGVVAAATAAPSTAASRRQASAGRSTATTTASRIGAATEGVQATAAGSPARTSTTSPASATSTASRPSPASTSTGSAGASSGDWRPYGPLQIDWSKWQAMGGSHVAPSLSSDGKARYLAVNCTARKLNRTTSSGEWNSWESPQQDFETKLVQDICREKDN